ncbi:zinc ribbon domain-containing protein [Burkholderia sp. Bp9125]|nr:zinc ribbon domain-containing protein [Burkholderia sp. Bp9125]
MTPHELVLYVYRCPTCGHAGEVHLDDDSHEGEHAHCDSCGAPVALEWDGGVQLSCGNAAKRRGRDG